jgi:2-beta-glucuronyltransferase
MVYDFVVLSATHDYRSAAKASIQFIAGALARKGRTAFIATHSSGLSRLRGRDTRSVHHVHNRFEHVDGVDCFLWHSRFHPLNWRGPQLDAVQTLVNDSYVSLTPSSVRQALECAKTVIIESGCSLVFASRIRKLNPKARIIYHANDELASIGLNSWYDKQIEKLAGVIDDFIITSPSMTLPISADARVKLVPHGMDLDLINAAKASQPPFGAGIHAVSAGATLFDRSFVEIAGRTHPSLLFHIIGSNDCGPSGENVRWYDSMSFEAVLAYFAHCSVGLAPYLDKGTSTFMADTSMKLKQFGILGKPAVCPHFAVGNHVGRFGYEPGNQISIKAAIDAALAAGDQPPSPSSDWDETVEAILA